MTGTASPAGDLWAALGAVTPWRARGRIMRCGTISLTAAGLESLAAIGDVCALGDGTGGPEASMLAEVVALDPAGARLLPYGSSHGVTLGTQATLLPGYGRAHPGPGWLGRVVDGFGRPIDGGPGLRAGPAAYPLDGTPVPAQRRRPLGARLNLGVRALDLLTPCQRGQRLGIFAGSGVGKSSLLAMLARHSTADAIVLGLIGERGREVGLFLDEVLGEGARARTATVVATSDQPAMLRKRAAHMTLAVAEALRDQGLDVLCLLDSVSRYAMALREIHLAAGEPPASRGYPPGVFADLPRLLERAGTGQGEGSITGLFTVLVEGDDLSDPIADAVRGILDGHVVLDRGIAERGRFPAIDATRSLSRTAPGCYSPAERPLVARARQLLKTYDEMSELIQLGGYRPGSDPLVDEAIRLRPGLEAVLAQDADEGSTIDDALACLGAALEPA